jgi:hypothetical protein
MEFKGKEAHVAQSYFKDFWIITTDGDRVFPARILDKDTGEATYRTLARGNNEKANGRLYREPLPAIEAFLNGAALRFGPVGKSDNRFYKDGPKTARVDATPAFRAANPHLRF